MSDSGNTTPSEGRRTPKVGVYVPRHRRENNDQPSESESNQNVTASSSSSAPRPRQENRRTQRNTTTSSDNLNEDRPPGSGSNGEVQKRGRGKFMGPGTGGSTNASGENSRNYREHRNNGNSPSHTKNNNSSSTYSKPQQPPTAPTAPAQRHPRGRDFDATVLRRYSDDENKPGSSFSRSSGYGSGRSNNNGLSTTQSSPRSKGRVGDSYNNKRADESSSWRQSPKSIEDPDRSPAESTKMDNEIDSGLSDLVEKINIGEGGERKSEPASSEELEEWELALQDSDEDAIPRIDNSKTSKSTKPHPAEHLLSSPSQKTTKSGNWSEVVDDDMYILELYDFSPSIKTMHLTDMFAPFENRSGGFRIKWLDDTKALVIFESAAVAKQAYISNITNQIAKIKPYTGTDKDTIRNAGNPSSGVFNGVRPAKTDSVARRLVQGALGLRVRRTPEQIAEEKALVQAAKEAREAQRQEQLKQRQEMDAMFHS
ncbi:R3H and coiled-coil domain-containing protein 1 [Haplosporangium sp. Z 27]|nr:R3H and coiled-coil domain-containing protein 1 [Haplosporangium sp. Z 27]